MKDKEFICECNSTSKIGCICEYDFGLEAMKDFNSDEMEKCADLIISPGFTL